jgi:hypothetical protein
MRSRVSSPKDLKSRASGCTSTDIWKYVYPNAPLAQWRAADRRGHKRRWAPGRGGLGAGSCRGSP